MGDDLHEGERQAQFLGSPGSAVIDGAQAAAAAKRIGAQFCVATTSFAIDLRDPAAIGPGVAAMRNRLSPLGGLVHSAGVADPTGLDGLTIASWDAGIAVHLRAIAAIASIKGTLGNGVIRTYSAAKGGNISSQRTG